MLLRCDRCLAGAGRCASRLNRQPSFLPGIPATQQGTRVRPSRPLKLSRHTGACLFTWSSTVCNKPCILGQTESACLHLDPLGNETDGPTYLRVTSLVGTLRTCVQQDDLGAFLLEVAHFLERDAEWRKRVLLICTRRAISP